MWKKRFSFKSSKASLLEAEPKSKNDYLQLILVGDAGCGKTSLMNRYSRGQFQIVSAMTIGCDITYKTVKIEERSFTVQIWDTAGQERYDHCLGPMFFRHKKGVLLVYQDGNRKSFDELQRTERWLTQVQQQSPDAVAYLVAAQCDKEEKRADSQGLLEDAKAFAESLEMPFYRTSSKTGENVERVFTALVADVVQKFDLLSAPSVQIAETVQLGGLESNMRRLNCCAELERRRKSASNSRERNPSNEHKSSDPTPTPGSGENDADKWAEIISIINECEEADEDLLNESEIDTLFDLVKKHDQTILEMFRACDGIKEKKRRKRFARNAKRLLSDYCVICETDAPEMSFFPCGHFCTCTECCNQLMDSSKRCPICRQEIKQFAKMFSS